MKKYILLLSILLFVVSCGKKEMKYWERVELGEGLTKSHVLSVTCKDDAILVGTFAKGALFSEDRGESWRYFKAGDSNDNTTIAWNYITGGDWKGDEIILASSGNGFSHSTDKGKTWNKYGYSFLGIEFLYGVGAFIKDKEKYIPTADGIIYFDGLIDPNMEYDELPFNVIDENQGLASQYIYDMAFDGDNILVGSLHGFSVSADSGKHWSNFSPNGSVTKEGKAKCKVRAVAAFEEKWFAGCDDGLFYSDDEGRSWKNISRGLPSLFIHDILIDKEGDLWVATYKGVVFTDNLGQSYRVFGKTSGFYGQNINCLAQSGDGNIYAGTNWGLYRMVEQIPAVNYYPDVQTVYDKLEKPTHQWMLRPVSSDYNDMKDQTYLYGSKYDGSFRQHQGNEYNNPEGVKLRAVDSGTIVFINKRIGHLVLKCDTRFEDYFVYAHYHHMDESYFWIGKKVNRGEFIGAIGKKGNVTNEHLNFEVSLSETDDSNVPNETVNPELWKRPLPGCGTIAGSVVDTAGNPLMGVKIYGIEKPIPTETPFSYAETYRDSVNTSPAYNENFVIGDVPDGEYLLWAEYNDSKYAVKAKVGPAKVTRVTIVVE